MWFTPTHLRQTDLIKYSWIDGLHFKVELTQFIFMELVSANRSSAGLLASDQISLAPRMSGSTTTFLLCYLVKAAPINLGLSYTLVLLAWDSARGIVPSQFTPISVITTLSPCIIARSGVNSVPLDTVAVHAKVIQLHCNRPCIVVDREDATGFRL